MEIFSNFDQNVIRIIYQYLSDRGLTKVSQLLSETSTFTIELTEAQTFRNSIMEGDWVQTVSSLDKIYNSLKKSKEEISNSNLKKINYHISVQKYLEQLELEDKIGALKTLRNEIVNSGIISPNKIRELSSYLMYNNLDKLKQVTNWSGTGQHSRTKLIKKVQQYLPAHVLLPPTRLKQLLDQSRLYQLSKNPKSIDLSNLTEGSHLLQDLNSHEKPEGVPSKCIQVLEDHCDEILDVKFSNNGKWLASVSKDETIKIYKVLNYGLKLSLTIEAPEMNTGSVIWSPDDNELLACPIEEVPGKMTLYQLNLKEDDQKDSTKLQNFPDSLNLTKLKTNSFTQILKIDSDTTKKTFTRASFSPDGKNFCAGGLRGTFAKFGKSSSSELAHWFGVRVRDCSWLNDGRILVADTQNRVQEYHFIPKNNIKKSISDGDDYNGPKFLFEERNHIIAMKCFQNKISKVYTAILSVCNRGVRMWDIDSCTLLRTFYGVRQSDMVYDTALLGSESQYIAAGCENKTIFIWHVKSDSVFKKLEGHQDSINAITCYNNMLVSCSDDRTIRVWL